MGDKSNRTSAAPTKKELKFKPKVPPRKMLKPAITQMEPPDDSNDILDSKLLRMLNPSHGGLERKEIPRKLEQMHVEVGLGGESSSVRSFGISKGGVDESKHQVKPMHVELGHGDESPSAGSFGISEGMVDERKHEVEPMHVELGHGGESSSLLSFGISEGSVDGSKHQGGGDVLIPTSKKHYVQPWDTDSYYPVTLPWRRPDARDPEILDEEEFGEDSVGLTQDETCINPAEELGLMEESEQARILFFQLPKSLPLEKRSAVAVTGKEIKKGCRLQELPAGFMGKLLVYKSGIVKMKLGNTLFDVSPGVRCTCVQEVAAINTTKKHCCIVGNVERRAVVTPDVDSLLDDIMNSD